jgi:hypothetical protein
MEWEAPPTEIVFFLAGTFLLAVRLMLPCMVGSPVLANIDDILLLAAVIGIIGWLVVAASPARRPLRHDRRGHGRIPWVLPRRGGDHKQLMVVERTKEAT